MVTKVETNKSGIKKDKKSDSTFRELTSVVDKKKKRQDGDAEAGVDPQVDQLNDMPNDPHTHPKEKKETNSNNQSRRNKK